MTLQILLASTGSGTPTVSSPTFSPGAGTYTGTQSVDLSSSTSGASIYYTTNGSTPTTGSTPYTGTISVAATQTIKAIATHSGYNNSSVASASYTINTSTAALRVSGNKLINPSGSTVYLYGANASGMEYQLNSPSAYAPNYSTLATAASGINCVRIPLNSAAFQNLTCMQINSSFNGWTGGSVSADPSGTYKSVLFNRIAAAQAAGLYVILDCHWSSPDFTFGGVTAHALPVFGQSPFLNQNTDLGFWELVAQYFGTQATPQTGIDNTKIMFELFNEPNMDYAASGTTLHNLMLNGGTVSSFTDENGNSIAQSWPALGYQPTLTAVRNAGAQNICIINGPGSSASTEYFTSYVPTDTLSPPQLAMGWHCYPSYYSSYPSSGGYIYPGCGTDGGGAWIGTANAWNGAAAVLSAGYPVFITEDGGVYGSDATSGEPHIDYVTQGAQSRGIHYLGWCFYPPPGPTTGTNFMYNGSSWYAGEGVRFLANAP